MQIRLHISGLPGIAGAPAVQKIESPLTFIARAAEHDGEHQSQDFPWRHDGDLSRGSGDRRPWHGEPAHLLERLAERDVLAHEQALGEPAGLSVGLPSAEKETASDPAD